MGEQRANTLYYGDNLAVMRDRIDADSVDLVYLDPPFNSNRAYNVLFANGGEVGNGASAQISAFGDTWHWTHVTDQQYQRYVLAAELPPHVGDALTAYRTLLGENDAMAYLVNMAPRLVELHRALKPSGSLYLHCDPTMSHYLKILLDSIFGAERFRSEIIWKRHGSHNDARGWGAVHDVILYYTKTAHYTFNKQYTAYDDAYIAQRFRFADPDGRRWMEQNLSSPNPRPNLTYPYTATNGVTYEPPRNGWKVTRERMAELDAMGRLHFPVKGSRLRLKNYLDEGLGLPAQDIWTDIPVLGGTSPERLGYQTQKPVALLERIIKASTNPGDTVLDPFCGCGTAVDAAQRLGRRWIGIDITFIAVDLIQKRLEHAYGPTVASTYTVHGIPKDMGGARALFDHSEFDFERWAVSMLNAQPNEKQRGDKGIDGVARFYLDRSTVGRVLVSVKGGTHINPAMARDLLGTVESHKAQMGVLVLMAEPTPGIRDVADHGGTYTWPVNGQVYPRMQVITVRELLAGKRPAMPQMNLPYVQATRAEKPSDQQTLDVFSTQAGFEVA